MTLSKLLAPLGIRVPGSCNGEGEPTALVDLTGPLSKTLRDNKALARGQAWCGAGHRALLIIRYKKAKRTPSTIPFDLHICALSMRTSSNGARTVALDQVVVAKEADTLEGKLDGFTAACGAKRTGVVVLTLRPGIRTSNSGAGSNTMIQLLTYHRGQFRHTRTIRGDAVASNNYNELGMRKSCARAHHLTKPLQAVAAIVTVETYKNAVSHHRKKFQTVTVAFYRVHPKSGLLEYVSGNARKRLLADPELQGYRDPRKLPKRLRCGP